MSYKMTKLTCALITLFTCSQVRGQERSELNCQGTMGNAPAVLAGVREYAPYNAVGDGYVRFMGAVSAAGISGRIKYEGYTRTGAFEGVIATSQGVLRIDVLDNTGGQMIIYDGKPSLGAPETIGRFVCRWR
jgi:hypothetical protein